MGDFAFDVRFGISVAVQIDTIRDAQLLALLHVVCPPIIILRLVIIAISASDDRAVDMWLYRAPIDFALMLRNVNDCFRHFHPPYSGTKKAGCRPI